jgi:tetratricopeptide (TPR) repeat protein
MAETLGKSVSAPAGNSAADALALGAEAKNGGLDPRAAAYLEEQTRLARLQIDNLTEQNAFELSHLRWRRFRDRMSGLLQCIIALIGVMIVGGIAATLWNASRADGLVIDSFSAPPDLVARGVDGESLATGLTDRIVAIRDLVNARSLARSGDVEQNGRQDIKVEIPNTGVSLGEVWRYLRQWLGHEHHVSGSLLHLANGNIELWSQLDGNIVSVSGPATDLDVLEQRVAEQIFSRVDPINGVIYLWETGRYIDAQKLAGENTHAAGNPDVCADGYALWSETTLYIVGNAPLANARARVALALYPKLAIADQDLAEGEQALGNDEAALQAERAALATKDAEQPVFLQGAGFAFVRSKAQEALSSYLGDFIAATAAACGTSCEPAHLDDEALYAALSHDTIRARRLMETASALERSDPLVENRAQYEIAAAIGDWVDAIAAVKARPGLLLKLAYMAPARFTTIDLTQTRPRLAYALARSDALAKAEAVVAGTPLGCYDCLRARGNIRALERDWNAAAFWFARAVQAGPSIPFAYFDWGKMLLAKGDNEGAIAKFREANRKGPHFADPLEMWGEAVIRENRSDLALAKFTEADKYAPNWGRLHLKWGEALIWTGDKAGAQKEFGAAATFDLTAAEKSELARVSAAHV